MPENIEWVCESCDSSNSVTAGEPAICRFCRLTYDVRIAPESRPSGEQSPAVEAAAELLRSGDEPFGDPESAEVTRPYRFRKG